MVVVMGQHPRLISAPWLSACTLCFVHSQCPLLATELVRRVFGDSACSQVKPLLGVQSNLAYLKPLGVILQPCPESVL